MKLEFESNGFSWPVSISRNFPLVTGRFFRHIFHGFDPKTTQKCCTLPCDVDPVIKNDTTTFWKSGFLSTSIPISQRSFSSFVNENRMPLDHCDLISSFHATNSSFKPTFSECRIILNFRSILFVPLRSLHENYFVWALHHFCKLQNLSSFKTDQFLWNIISFVPRSCRVENWIRPLNGGVHYPSTHTAFWHDQLISRDEMRVCSMTVVSINPDCCYQRQIVSIRINYTDGAIKTWSCSHDGWHVFSSNKQFLSLSHDMWKHARSAFFFEVLLDFESFSPNSSLGARAWFNHVTAEVLSSFPNTMNESWNAVLTILAVNVYHTWNSSRGPGFVLDPRRAPKRCGQQKVMVIWFLAAAVFLSPGARWCLLNFLYPVDWTHDNN